MHFFYIPLSPLRGSSCLSYSIWLQFRGPAWSEMVYTFSGVFIWFTFFQLVRAKHTVRIWKKHRRLSLCVEQKEHCSYVYLKTSVTLSQTLTLQFWVFLELILETCSCVNNTTFWRLKSHLQFCPPIFYFL